jgi:hypothetical protein
MTSRAALSLLAALLIGANAAVAQVRPSAPTRAAGKPAPAPAVADVKLDVLKSTPTTLPPSTRNPFRFSEAPAKVAAPRTGPANPRQGLTVAPPAEASAPPGPPPPPPILLRFIGLIDAPERAGRVALLSDGKGGLMNGREGDVIEGRYRVLRVGADSLDLAYVDGRGRQTIRLSGQ